MNAHVDVTDPDDTPLYEARRKIHPQSVKGTFRTVRWIVLAVTLGIYYLTPFLRWDRGPNAPDQAVLIDLSGRRLYFFFIEIWPQEVYFITGLLVLAALTLFLMNAVAGRVWCGYLCPQTVWTDLFLAIERLCEGDRRERIAKDKAGLTVQTIAEKGLKHLLWLVVAWWTGGAWVLYFADAPTLVKELATFQAPTAAYAFIAILTFTTYMLAGHMREQVCLYMCPWPRIQAALTDEYAYNVTYRFDRGEPRMSLKAAERTRARGEPAGDCIDCNQCVAVCPTGVDIRQGPSLGCIQCGLCIDACDSVMTKVGRAPRLIAYDTDVNIRARQQGKPAATRIIRPRTVLYVALIALVGGLMLWQLATRSFEGASLLHDRNPIFVRLSDGAIRNGYTLRILNKRPEARRFAVVVSGLDGLALDVVGATVENGVPVVAVGRDQTREVRLLIDHRGPAPDTAPITVTVTALEDGASARAVDHFRGP